MCKYFKRLVAKSRVQCRYCLYPKPVYHFHFMFIDLLLFLINIQYFCFSKSNVTFTNTIEVHSFLVHHRYFQLTKWRSYNASAIVHHSQSSFIQLAHFYAAVITTLLQLCLGLTFKARIVQWLASSFCTENVEVIPSLHSIVKQVKPTT